MSLIQKVKRYYKQAYRMGHFPSVRSLFFSKNKVMAYHGFLGDGNFGDELVFEATKSLFSSITILPIHRQAPLSSKLYKKIFWRRINGIIIGGGTIISKNRIDQVEILDKLKNESKCLFIHGAGVNQNVFGEFWQKILSKDVYGGVRGPLSKDNMLNNLNIEVPILGDAALALFDENKFKENKHSRKVLINFGSHDYFENSKHARNIILEFAEKLGAKGYDICFLPFHSIDIQIGKRLKDEYDNIHLLDIPVNYEAACLLFNDASFAVGERLHFSVMATLCRCPFISINYDKKHNDFLKSLDLEAFGFRIDDLTIEELDHIFENRGNLFSWHQVKEKIEHLQKAQFQKRDYFLDLIES